MINDVHLSKILLPDALKLHWTPALQKNSDDSCCYTVNMPFDVPVIYIFQLDGIIFQHSDLCLSGRIPATLC